MYPRTARGGDPMKIQSTCAVFGAFALIAAGSCGDDQHPPNIPGNSSAGAGGVATHAGAASFITCS
jgi:hypothetical protein